MQRMLLLFAVVTSVFGQTLPTRISPDEAEKHLPKNPSPVYPPFAEATRISGTVVLEMETDDLGRTLVQRVISGHPLLISAAIEDVKSWKYQPFELDGKATSVITLAMVTIGPSGNQPAEALAEMQIQHQFWTATDSARTALEKGNSTVAAQELKRQKSYSRRSAAACDMYFSDSSKLR